VRKILRSPVVKSVARWANKEPFIWDGIYESFDQVPVAGEGFASDVWLADMERYTSTALMALRNEDGIPENVPQHHALSSILIASLAAERRPLRVIDFGGGMGVGIANLMRCGCLSGEMDCEYVVIDNEASCERGRRLFRDLASVKFMSELPREPGAVDVVVLSSVLQFVENYDDLLTRLASFAPRLWLFTFVPAGDIPTFATAQLNVPGSVIPSWFFNLPELIEKIEARGYELIFKSALDRVFDMSNFPLTHQLPRQCNLLFRRG
jgi:putative methyltransferase (TIGR04325 family)